jgi:precorrin-8X/cobalt-precorrin-8 methylmutase
VKMHPIEAESMRILAAQYDLSRFGPLGATVVARVVHATADPSFISSMVVEEAAVQAGVDAMLGGAVVVTDVEMARAGIAYRPTACYLHEAHRTGKVDGTTGTRSGAGIALAATRHPSGAVVAIGCAPSALVETVRLVEAGAWRPALVVGLPVGFVGAAESKELARSLSSGGVPVISNIGERGGSGVVAAAMNAIARLAAVSGEDRGDEEP